MIFLSWTLPSFGLEMAESTSNKGKQSLVKENAEPVANAKASGKKRLRLSLNKKSKPTPHEWSSFFSSEVKAAQKAVFQKNMKKCTDWSVCAFRPLLTQRNQCCTSCNKCQEDILLTDDHEFLCKCLCIFASKLHKEDGSPYAQQCIAQFFAVLHHCINENKSELVQTVDRLI